MQLHREAVASALLDVLGSMYSWPELKAFYLVGGTALALYLGHRRSVDIDLFTHTSFDPQPIADRMTREMTATQVETGKNLVRCFVHNIKVDVIAHQYPILEPVNDVASLRIASLPDIAAMKLNAIANRGAKKDFWDVAALLDRYPLSTLLEFHARKYGSVNQFAVAKSLVYFADADMEDLPILDLSGMTWQSVKAKIQAASADLMRNA